MPSRPPAMCRRHKGSGGSTCVSQFQAVWLKSWTRATSLSAAAASTSAASARMINLAYTPEAEIGKYVLVHVGFAISVIDEEEAQRVFKYLEEMGGLEEELGEIPQ